MEYGSSTECLLIADIQENSIKITTPKTENCDNKNVFAFHILLKEIDSSKITALDFSYCQLTDLPIIDDIVNLKQFIVAHNSLSEVPSCLLTHFKNLELLDLSHNHIRIFDFEPACMANLRKIKLNNNKFKNVPKWFLTFRAVNLKEFNYSMNKASHYNHLKNSYNLNFLKLRKLELKNCHLIDYDYSFLRCFHHLVYLDISNDTDQTINKFYETDELFIKTKWKELKILKMNNLSIAMFPEGIAWLESLVELHFKNNCISWLPDDMEFMVNLEVLDVSNNELIGIPDKLVKLERLKVLKAASNWIQTTPDFKLMNSLACLDLFDNMLTNISIDINKLNHIDLENNYLNSNELHQLSLYKECKENYRLTQFLSRGDGIKEIPYLDHSSSDSVSETEQHSLTPMRKKVSLLNAEQNWDLPVTSITQRNPDIDSEDDKWNDEVISFKYPKNDKIYVEDEDWMFEDVYEEYAYGH